MNNLILAICSNAKLPNDTARKYDVGARKIIDILPDDKRRVLNHYRDWAFRHTIKRNREWKYLHTIPLNKNLKLGPDIFPTNREDSIIYMPALKRYTGRFYNEFRSAVGDIDACMKRLNGNSENHFLIVSGLYGLLMPTELIQEYNCNIPEKREIRQFWKDSDLLPNLVIAYVRKHEINRLFDFMAEDSYRHLVDWRRIEEETPCKIFYSYSSSPREGEQIGVNSLPRLGHAAGLLLKENPEIKLSDIRSGRVVCSSGIRLKSDAPQWAKRKEYNEPEDVDY